MGRFGLAPARQSRTPNAFCVRLSPERSGDLAAESASPPDVKAPGWVFCTAREQIERGIKMRVKVTLACTECKQRNYDSMKNKKNDPERIEMSKYCKFCRKHTVHKETK
jgi:large subunit ribosomal protein L33